MSLDGKTALVTGATSGIGRAVAEEGAEVIVSGRDGARGEQVVASITANGARRASFRPISWSSRMSNAWPRPPRMSTCS